MPDGNGRLYGFDRAVGSGPTINNLGEVGFYAKLAQTAAPGTGLDGDDSGVFIAGGPSGTLRIVARAAASAPDGNGNFADGSFTYITINDAGQVAFISRLRGTFGGADDTSGIFRGDGAAEGVTQIARGGQLDPDGVRFSPFDSDDNRFALNQAGQVVFSKRSVGVFRSTGNAITRIVRRGQAAPDGDGTFYEFSFSGANDAGLVAFEARINNPTHYGIFRGDESALVQIARTGDVSPDANGTFSRFSNPAINNAGDVAFLATLTGTNGSAADNQGAYIHRDGVLLVMARRGQQAPDGNGLFLNFNGPDEEGIGEDNVAINDAGQVAFLATLTGTTGGVGAVGLFRADGTTVKQIVRLGDVAPDGVSRFNRLSLPALNNAGQVAFHALLTTSTSTSDAGIFLYDDVRGLVQLIREGDSVLGSTIRSDLNIMFQPSVTTFGRARGALNDIGQVVSSFFLADGRWVIAVASAVRPTCVGDCDGSGDVTVAELITMVNIALGNTPLSACTVGDADADGRITINEMISAVNNALGMCPA